MVILWCGSAFAVYRLGLFAVDYQGPCKCLGNWGAVFSISDDLLNMASMIILMYLLVPSGAIYAFTRMFSKHHNGATVGAGASILSALMAGCFQASAAAGSMPGRGETALLVEGVVSNNFTAYPTNTPMHLRHKRFSLMLANGQWLAHIEEAHNPPNKWTLFSDGTNTYCLNDMTRLAQRDIAEGRNHRTNLNVATAAIRNTSVPLFSLVEEMGVLWLTYASGNYFNTGGLSGFKYQPCIIGILGGGNTIYPYPRKYKCSGLVKGYVPYPTNVSYFHAMTNCSDENLVRALKPYWDKTNALFVVTETTLLNERPIPVASMLTSRDLVKEYQFHLIATNIQILPPIQLSVPAMPGKTFCSDFRFTKGHEYPVLTYMTTNWLTIEEAKRLPQYKKVFRMLEKRGTVKILFSFFLATLLIVGPFLLARVGWHVRNSKKPQPEQRQ